MEIVEYFKAQFDAYRNKVATYFKEGKEPREWDFAPVFAFARFDAFTNRLLSLKVLTLLLSSPPSPSPSPSPPHYRSVLIAPLCTS